MADTTRQVTFDIVARDRASRDFKRVGDAADRTSDRFQRFGHVSTRVAKAAGAAMGGALIAVGYGLAHAAKAAADEEREMVLLANALRKNTKANDASIAATEKWITATQNATGVADGDLRPALAKLVGATKNTAKAQKLLKVGLDFSASSGKSLDSVATALTKAYNGNVGALGRLGVKVQDSTKDAVAQEAATQNVAKAQKDLAAAIKEHGQTSDEAKTANDKLSLAQMKLGEATGKVKKTTISFDEAMQRLNKQFGGSAAAAAKTTAGTYAILKARFQDLQEEIGARLLPYLNRLGKWFLDKGIPALARFGGWIRDKLWPALKDFGASVGKGVLGFFSNLGDALGQGDDGASNLTTTVKGFGDTLTKVVLPAVGKFVEKTLPALGIAMGKQIDLTLDLASALVDMALIGVRAFSGLARAALNGLGAIVNGMDKVRFLFPAISGKIHEAAGNFDSFRSRTLKNLKQTETGLVAVKEALARIRSKSITIDVDYAPSGIPGKFAGKAIPRASGGPMRAGQPYWVGEQGPELVTPTRNGWVNDARSSASMTSGGGVHIENLNVTSGPGERAEQSVPRALRRVVWAF